MICAGNSLRCGGKRREISRVRCHLVCGNTRCFNRNISNYTRMALHCKRARVSLNFTVDLAIFHFRHFYLHTHQSKANLLLAPKGKFSIFMFVKGGNAELTLKHCWDFWLEKIRVNYVKICWISFTLFNFLEVFRSKVNLKYGSRHLRNKIF